MPQQCNMGLYLEIATDDAIFLVVCNRIVIATDDAIDRVVILSWRCT